MTVALNLKLFVISFRFTPSSTRMTTFPSFQKISAIFYPSVSTSSAVLELGFNSYQMFQKFTLIYFHCHLLY
jgi:hypothetical protein